NVNGTNHGRPSVKGDKFYRCLHGESKKILKISKAMHSSLNGLTGHLKSNAPDMHQLFEILLNRGTPPTPEEKAIAQGQKKFSSRAELKKFMDKYATLATHQQTLRQSLARASEKELGDWDQKTFERLLLEWLVACDQPFQEVE
ncbi:hypothetical protein DFH07DRAFT_723366, partial [Mycena maculata]